MTHHILFVRGKSLKQRKIIDCIIVLYITRQKIFFQFESVLSEIRAFNQTNVRLYNYNHVIIISNDPNKYYVHETSRGA